MEWMGAIGIALSAGTDVFFPFTPSRDRRGMPPSLFPAKMALTKPRHFFPKRVGNISHLDDFAKFSCLAGRRAVMQNVSDCCARMRCDFAGIHIVLSLCCSASQVVPLEMAYLLPKQGRICFLFLCCKCNDVFFSGLVFARFLRESPTGSLDLFPFSKNLCLGVCAGFFSRWVDSEMCLVLLLSF